MPLPTVKPQFGCAEPTNRRPTRASAWYMTLVSTLSFALISGLSFTASTAKEPAAKQIRFFESEIRPLLAANCFKCHGAAKQKGRLRLDSREALLVGGESGPAVAPGAPDESLLVDAINYESLEMPPSGKLTDEEIALLTKWVRIGAPWPGNDSKAKPTEAMPKITDKDRSHWAFQPLRDAQPPECNDDGWCRNEVDRFIFQRLEAEGLSPAAEATPLALLRRVHFNLVGVPPTPEEVSAFEAEVIQYPKSAFPNLVDRLLDDPRYGERWARHWLDLVRYAESDGYKADGFRPHAWRYRDYVIRSLNDDKPYDQFVMEQLAGDEIGPHDVDAIVATGYLRHWIYEYNQRDVRTQWDTILNDITDVTGDVFLGMGMGCARCHDHKFDPILQKDYYRLRAFFAPLMPREDVPLASAEELSKYHLKRIEWENATEDIRHQIEEIEQPYIDRAAQPAIKKFPPDIRPMMAKAPSRRLPLEHQLAEFAYRQANTEIAKLNFETKLKGEEREQWLSLKKQLSGFDHLKPKPLPNAVTVSDVGAIAPPTIIPGDREKRDIAPGFLTILDPADTQLIPPPMVSASTGRRTALARWIASRNNPLSTRVIVNRIWQYHFGRGLVDTSSDFGNLGRPPSHPELLDWLTNQFIEGGWKFKKLHRLILTSATYRQAALIPNLVSNPKSEIRNPQSIDPGNKLLWRTNVRRLQAEQIRDAMLAVSGELNPRAGGPSVDHNSPRRTIYTKVIRNNRDPLLDVFDAPDNFNSTSERNVTTTPTQSLLMINGSWTLARARAFASRIEGPQANKDDADIVDRAYQLAFSRSPNANEKSAALKFLADQTARLASVTKVDDSPLTERMPSRESVGAALKPTSRQKTLYIPDSESLPTEDFTIEAIVVINSLYEDASVRTIAAQWDGNHGHPGWSFGVTSKKSAYDPRNLILQIVGDPKQGGTGYEVVASNLRPELNRPYYLAASVKPSDSSEKGITFYMQDLSAKDTPLQSAYVAHKATTLIKSTESFTIGGRAKIKHHTWDGLIDEVRLSKAALDRDALLLGEKPNSGSIAGHWKFEAEPGFFLDSSPHQNNIASAGENPNEDPKTAALVDFCHILLNSNEFLYVD